MISYKPLWATLQLKGYTSHTLRNKFEDVGLKISGSTLQRLQKGESVSTNTLDTLCKILKCDLKYIVSLIPDEDIKVDSNDNWVDRKEIK